VEGSKGAQVSVLAVAMLLVALGAGDLFQPVPPSSIYRGCGCKFLHAEAAGTDQVIFTSNYEGAARIQAGGQVLELQATRPDSACRPARVGARCVLKYRGDIASIVLKARATQVCPAGDVSESCEVVSLEGQLSGRIGEVEEVLDVHGECGC
jgi:hypothetical protein